MPSILDLFLVAVAFGAACVYLFFVFRSKKCGGCGTSNRPSQSKRLTIQLPKK